MLSLGPYHPRPIHRLSTIYVCGASENDGVAFCAAADGAGQLGLRPQWNAV
jgi:hypothetical protein